MEELEKHLPGQVKRYLAQNNINFYTIDGVKLGIEIGLGNRINTILQSAFFKLANIIPIDDAIKYMKDAATASYSKKGDHIDLVELIYGINEMGCINNGNMPLKQLAPLLYKSRTQRTCSQ